MLTRVSLLRYIEGVTCRYGSYFKERRVSSVWILQMNEGTSEEVVAVLDHKPSIRELKKIIEHLSSHAAVDYLPEVDEVVLSKLGEGHYLVEAEGSDLHYTDFLLEKFEVMKKGSL